MIALAGGFAGCADEHSPVTGAAPSETVPATTASVPDVPDAPDAPDHDETSASFLGFTAPKPATWIWQPPQNRMQAAKYVVPGSSGMNQARLVVFQGIGGSVEANIDRWVGQFRSPEKGPVEPLLSRLEADGIPITFVELSGEHRRMGAGWYTPNQIFLAGIVEAEEGYIHITLRGQQETVAANRDAFITFLRGMRRVDGP